ncbi:MAG: fibronectin type III domain-containing protein [Candidatus Krumholzibacteria bacterium]|nr:fibronectin type III domain-containing protein [Candidatus Krumholzibacteria bacterium]
MRRILSAIFIVMLALILGSCLDDVTEVPLSISDESVPAPTGLSACIADGMITLQWQPVDNVSGYRVYRSVDTEGRSEFLSTASNTAYVDSDVQNGRAYYYAVSAVRGTDRESKLSEEIRAVPAIYSILVNGGEASTNSTSVTLAITAPETTERMMISTNASLDGGVWETYASARSWRLEGPDGVKRVYATFMDQDGGSTPVFCDSIILDTYAMIESIEISPVPRLYAIGATVRFAMQIEEGERGGTASISLEKFGDKVILNDNGNGGDVTAGDGVYEADFRFPDSVRGVDLVVVGDFADRAGNAAPQFECPDRISFTDPPEAVQLMQTSDSSRTSITIKWTASDEEHFALYRIYRSTTSSVGELPSQLLTELSSQAQTRYVDDGLKEGSHYYYRIYVVNDLGETAGSNTVSVHTLDAYPDAVVLDEPSSIGTNRLTLTWSVSSATDFKEYRLYRSTAPGVTTSSTLVATISESEVTFFDDTGLDLAGNIYYYRVFVFDQGGKSSRSNEVDTAD